MCTSLSRMNLAADVLRGPIGRTGCSLYLQGKQSKAEIARRFLTDDSPVLLGSVSFREGFDAPGRRLTWVILDRLPFPRPGDPVFERMRGRLVEVAQKRLSSEEMGEEERSFLKEMVEEKSSVLSTNSMLSDLVQSMGRLIRSDGDYGTITLLDSRAVVVEGVSSPWKGKLDKVLRVMGEGVSVEAPDWLPSSFYSACKTLQVRATRSRQEKERLERLDRGI